MKVVDRHILRPNRITKELDIKLLFLFQYAPLKCDERRMSRIVDQAMYYSI